MKTPFHIALNAQTFAHSTDADADAPEWVHLVPSGADHVVTTGDNRGPYHVIDPNQVIAASFAENDRLPIDENHATDLAAPKGLPAPARGWIVAMQSRADGIWGRIEWTEEGRALVKGRAYRGISPVVSHTKDAAKNIISILRASLVNKPNLRGMVALHMESEMTLQERLVELTGLQSDAGDDAIMAAITKWKKAATTDAPALQSQLGEIGVALGLEATAKSTAIVTAAQAFKATKDDSSNSGVVVALQSELKELAENFVALQETTTRKAAEAFVDGAIKAGRVGVKPMRDRYIAMHMKDAPEAEALIGAMPKISGTTNLADPIIKDGEISLNAEQTQVANMLGISHKDYAATLKEERSKEEAL